MLSPVEHVFLFNFEHDLSPSLKFMKGETGFPQQTCIEEETYPCNLYCCFFCLLDFIIYAPVNIFLPCWDGSSWVEPVLSRGISVNDTTQCLR